MTGGGNPNKFPHSPANALTQENFSPLPQKQPQPQSQLRQQCQVTKK